MRSKKNVIGDFQKSIYSKSSQSFDIVKDRKLVEQISHLVQKSKCKILDVGCGDGHLLEKFAEVHDCYGVDISKALLTIARKRGIRTYCVNLEKSRLPFPSNFFDVIICSEVIEHIVNTDNLLTELNRVLKSGGCLILTFPNVNQPISWIVQIALDLPPVYSARYKSPHVRDYTLRIVQKILSDFGFKTINITGTYIYPFKGGFSQLLANKLSRFAEKIIIVSKKVKFSKGEPGVIWDSRWFLTR